MKKEVTVLVAMLFATSFTPLSATRSLYLIDENNNHYGEGQSVCANYPYSLVNDDRNSEVLILDQNTRQILDVFNVTENAPNVMFPTDGGNITLLINKYDENDKIDSSEQQSINLNIVDCGIQTKMVENYYTGEINEVKIEPMESYERSAYGVVFSYDGTDLKISKNEKLNNYQLSYQYLTKDKMITKKAKFHNTNNAEIKDLEYNVIQFHESYTNDAGNEVNNYFELELNSENNTYTLRDINEFGLHVIDKMDLIDWQVILWLIFLGGFYFLVNLAYRRQKRRYRRHKIRLMQEEQNGKKK